MTNEKTKDETTKRGRGRPRKYEAKKKVSEMTAEELAAHKARISEIRRAAGKRGGAAMHEKSLARSPLKSLSVREVDYDIIVNFARKQGKFIGEVIHDIAEHLVKKDPSLRE